MRISNFLTNIFLLVLLFPATGKSGTRDDYPNLLNIETHITDPKDIDRSFFSDMGAWHAYALPARPEDHGGFVGPLVMDQNGRWLGNSLSKLHVEENGERIDFSKARQSAEYFPGLLRERLEYEGLVIVQELIFVSNRESMIRTTITNLEKNSRDLLAAFYGEVRREGAPLKKKGDKVRFRFDNREKLFELDFYNTGVPVLTVDGKRYSSEYQFTLKPHESISKVQTHRYYLTPGEVPKKTRRLDFDKELRKNEARWTGYLDRYFASANLTDPVQKQLAAKAVVTLQTNWRSAAKDLKHDGIFPSASYQGFYGFWSWDSWKHAVALAKFHPELAESSIRSMFDYQDEHGMVADCIYTDKSENNWRNTKPPLAAWAVWHVYKANENRQFVREMYPKLEKYHRWWYKNRDYNQNGLAEYGSTDGTKKAAGWESGMDNAVRFDDALMVKNNDRAWSFDQESVDLNAYLYNEKLYLSLLLGAREENSTRKFSGGSNLRTEAAELGNKINQTFFSTENGFYYDYNFGRKKQVSVEGTEGWIPLWAGLVTKDQARVVAAMMMDPSQFNTLVPLPTFTPNYEKFDPLDGYWRGPVWLDQFYFGIKGLRRYDYDKEADELTAKLFKNAEGLMSNGEIRENYHPLTGKGLNAKNFSWSAAHILLLLEKPVPPGN